MRRQLNTLGLEFRMHKGVCLTRVEAGNKCQSPGVTFTSPPRPPTILPKQRGQEDRNATVLRQQDRTTQWRP